LNDVLPFQQVAGEIRRTGIGCALLCDLLFLTADSYVEPARFPLGAGRDCVQLEGRRLNAHLHQDQSEG
jgi:hypothetical protein